SRNASLGLTIASFSLTAIDLSAETFRTLTNKSGRFLAENRPPKITNDQLLLKPQNLTHRITPSNQTEMHYNSS
ncbi:MAG: hypothetical protein KDE51_03785, partial [Anaerolineales bacterium]|nr:hypothetical protein [Anaerolineales bacterium]